jgi:hypothetical protein
VVNDGAGNRDFALASGRPSDLASGLRGADALADVLAGVFAAALAGVLAGVLVSALAGVFFDSEATLDRDITLPVVKLAEGRFAKGLRGSSALRQPIPHRFCFKLLMKHIHCGRIARQQL